jgi:Ca-activated chloride channel homolog
MERGSRAPGGLVKAVASGVVAWMAVTATVVTAQAPTFSSRVDAVRVDVVVTDRGGFVRGLVAGDFELFDNGVRQSIDVVTVERLPLTVILALDLSASVAGERLEHLRAASLALLDELAPDDYVALITFSHLVSIRAPLTNGGDRARMALAMAAGEGRTALIDATHAAMMLAGTNPRRALVIVFSDGVDTASWLTADRVLDTARRSDVVVYGVAMPQSRKPAFATALTSLTGGSLITIGSTRDLRAAFVGILDEFRQRYVLSYVPEGVSAGGWHELDVRVRARGATVRARPGYMAP